MVFFVMRSLPGDPVLVYVSQNEVNSATPEQIEKIRHEFGLDKPVIVQYINWLGDICRGNLGRSVINRTSVNEEIGRALPKTMYLGSCRFYPLHHSGNSFGNYGSDQARQMGRYTLPP